MKELMFLAVVMYRSELESESCVRRECTQLGRPLLAAVREEGSLTTALASPSE